MLRRSNIMKIINFSITPKTAVANGADIISASAVIMNGNDYVSNEPIVFRITSGSAIFSNGLSSIVVSSNSLGAVSARLIDTVAETIVVEIALQSDVSVHDSLAATFTPSDNRVDNIGLLLVSDDARADGEDQNLALLQTFSGAVPVPGTDVSLSLTNGAVFISGEKTAKIKTDSKGQASLPFTSTTPGKSKLTAWLPNDISVYNSVTANFESASPDISLVLDVVSDNAQANGNAVNRLCATVTDSDTHKPLSGQEVTFTVNTGRAFFDNGAVSYRAVTDSNGETYAAVRDDTVETVDLSAEAGGKTAAASVHFKQTLSPLRIERVYNLNKTFPAGGPSTAWLEAKFSASAVGGSGTYSWAIDSEDVEVVYHNENSHKADFKFARNLPAYGSYTITLTDTETLEQDSYTFNLNVFFTHYADPKFYLVMLGIGFGNCPSTDELKRLYSDWGNMTPYGFVLDQNWGWYWTSDSNILTQTKIRLTDGYVASGLEQIIACCYSQVHRVGSPAGID